MTSRSCLAIAAVLFATPVAFAQGISAGARLNSPTRPRAEAPIAGTAVPLQTGRSVRRVKNVDDVEVSNGPSMETARICTNCDD